MTGFNKSLEVLTLEMNRHKRVNTVINSSYEM